jgi:4-hydroxy-3-methylbut-2-enyl diphosphate reductase
MDSSTKRLILVRPRGFCAGVVRAVDAVRVALDRFGPPIYVRHEIVHNGHVLRDLEDAGAIFVEELGDVPDGSRVFFSAHGVSPAVHEEAARRGLSVIDATCPLVSKVHAQARRLARAGYTIILVGHRDHVEVAGTRGEAPAATIVVSSPAEVDAIDLPAAAPLCYLTQTTLSLDDLADIIEALRRRFPHIEPPPSQDICYATENRQHAVRAIAGTCDMIVVVGSSHSSNSRSLVEVARAAGVEAVLVDSAVDLPWMDLADRRSVGLTAGASTPEWLFRSVVEAMVERGFEVGEDVEVAREDVAFALPPGLTDAAGQVPLYR